MDPADLRIGDAEREAAATELAEHYAQGRLDVDEHAERLDAVWAARTQRELDPVFADLRPRAPYTSAPRTYAAATAPRRRRRLPVPLMAVAVVLVAVAVLTHLPLILLGLAGWLVLTKAGRGHCGRVPTPHHHHQQTRWS